MKTLITLLLLSSASLFASTCTIGSLQSYIDLGATGCQVGNLQVSSFTTDPGQSFATPISPLDVLVTPGGTALIPNLLFTLNSTAQAQDLFESFFRFTAAGSGLTAAGIELVNPSASDDGAVTGILDVCAGGTFSGNAPGLCSGSARTAVAVALDGFDQLSDSFTYPSSSALDVFVDLTSDGGFEGSATLESARVSFTSTGTGTAVPEPGTAAILAAAVCFAATLKRRVSSRSIG